MTDLILFVFCNMFVEEGKCKWLRCWGPKLKGWKCVYKYLLHFVPTIQRRGEYQNMCLGCSSLCWQQAWEPWLTWSENRATIYKMILQSIWPFVWPWPKRDIRTTRTQPEQTTCDLRHMATLIWPLIDNIVCVNSTVSPELWWLQ